MDTFLFTREYAIMHNICPLTSWDSSNIDTTTHQGVTMQGFSNRSRPCNDLQSFGSRQLTTQYWFWAYCALLLLILFSIIGKALTDINWPDKVAPRQHNPMLVYLEVRPIDFNVAYSDSEWNIGFKL